MLESILIFMIFLGPLIFFHELGHFLMARIAGVKVEVFSIGFGPKLLKFKKGDTQYAFSLIPLGGYVKMFGDDPLSETVLTEDEKKVAYTHKSKLARFGIVFGGPLANFIMALCIYFGLLIGGEKVPQTRFGHVPQTSEYYQMGVRSGDVLKKVNDDTITSFDDLNLIDTNVSSITVERFGEMSQVSLSKSNIGFIKDFQRFQTTLRVPLVTDENGNVWGVSSNSSKMIADRSLELLDQTNPKVIYLFKFTGDFKSSTPITQKDFSSGFSKKVEVKSGLFQSLNKEGLFPLDLVVESIVMNSPADKAKLKSNDIIYKINDQLVTSFEQVRTLIQKYDDKTPLKLFVLRDNKKLDFEITPTKSKVGGQEVFTVGIYSGAKVLPIKMIDTPSKGLIGSLLGAFGRTYDGFIKTIEGYKRLIVGDVSLKNLGGPIAIGKVASDSFYISFSMFMRLMAIISINLGIINLFPIPVLDGGHIVFIIIEAINKGPLSRKKMEIAQQFGISMLFILIFIALFNDFSKLFS